MAQDVACSAVIAAGGRIEWAGVPGSFCVPSLCAAPCGRWGAAASMVVNGQVRTCPSMEKPGFGGRACWSHATGKTLSFLAELVKLASGFFVCWQCWHLDVNERTPQEMGHRAHHVLSAFGQGTAVGSCLKIQPAAPTVVKQASRQRPSSCVPPPPTAFSTVLDVTVVPLWE